jgi:hypothetical protein
MRFTLAQLSGHLTDLILAGATEIMLRPARGEQMVLHWRFPGQPLESLSFELAEVRA